MSVTLTLEQLQALSAEGLTTDQIVRIVSILCPRGQPEATIAARREKDRIRKQNKRAEAKPAPAESPAVSAKVSADTSDGGTIGGNLVLLPQEDSEKGRLETQPTRRGKTYLPEDFRPDQTCRELCDRLGFTDQDRLDWLEEFRDWCASKRPMYSDWQATARNSIKRYKRQSRSGNYGKPTIQDSLQIGLGRFLERQGGEDRGPDLRLIPGLREG